MTPPTSGSANRNGQTAENDEEQRQQIQNPTEKQPRPLLAALRPGSGEGGDEGAAQRAARHELKEQIGDAESGQIGVQVGAGAKTGADDHFPQQTRAPAQDEQQHDQRGCAGDPFTVQRPHAAALGLRVTDVRFRHSGRFRSGG